MNGEWLAHSPNLIEGTRVKPLVVSDSAFPLESTCIKCFEAGNVSQKQSFNYSLIRTRRVVEQGRWKIMDGQCRANDPVFVRQVAMVCCALHNVCERHQCPFEPGWLPDESAYINTTTANLQANVVIGSGSNIRDGIAKYIHRHRPAPQ